MSDINNLEAFRGGNAVQKENHSTQLQEIKLDEIYKNTQIDFTTEINAGKFTDEELKQYISERVQGVRLNGVNVILIKNEYLQDTSVHPILEAYMASQKTNVVMVEYFDPELRQNAEAAKYNIGVLISQGKNTLKAYEESIPIFPSLQFSRNLTATCQKLRKTVAVADIANKPDYSISRTLLRLFPIESFLTPPYETNLIQLAKVIINMGIRGTYYRFLESGPEKSTFGFDKKNIHPNEKFFIDLEDARRLFIAKGIEQLTQEYKPFLQNEHPEVEGKKDIIRESNPQIVVCYPEAHIRRILNYLQIHHVTDSVKEIIHKLTAPTLDYAVRTWEYKDQLQKLKESGYQWGKPDKVGTAEENSKPDLAGWRMVSKRPIPFIFPSVF